MASTITASGIKLSNIHGSMMILPEISLKDVEKVAAKLFANVLA